MKTGIEQAGSDTELATRIEKDASLSINDIEREIGTLRTVAARYAEQQQNHNPSLVPKSASGRPAPSLAGGGQGSGPQDIADEMLFMS
jgi:hypothetical protein